MQLIYPRNLFTWQRVSLALLSSHAFGVAGAAYVAKHQTGDPPTFDWQSIEPSKELKWVPCYTAPLRCTRLEVPLNYTSPEDGTGAVALVSYPSPLADTDSYRGPILFNPGGPGGSGVSFVTDSGAHYQEIFGPEFDIVGFDPRGVGATTPALTFPGTLEEELGWLGAFAGALDLREEFRHTLPERMQVVKEYAELAKRERDDVLRYMTTDLVARDMLSITQAHGKEKLLYWGQSYGTALGSVYASLFPDNVERMIIDGVLDLEGYYNNDWAINISDADKTLEWFFSDCAQAGPERCAFHGATKEDVRARYHTVETIVRTQNLTFPVSDDPSVPEVPFDMKSLHGIVHSMLYQGSSFPVLARALAEIELNKDVSTAIGTPGSAEQLSIYQVMSLRCTDTREVRDSPEELMEYAARLEESSRYLSSGVAAVRLSCVGWEINPGNFQGPMGGNTSFPLLFVGNTADPATPLLGAQLTSAKFPGSRVLVYDVPGHGTLSLRNNACIHATFRNYMFDGILPEDGEVCEDDRSFFPDPDLEDSDSMVGSAPLKDMGVELLGFGKRL